MDEISELEKYKDLLDSGAITEEEFTQLKQKLLGLKTDEEKEAERQAERAEALKEIDAMREAQKKKEEEAQKKQEEARQQNQEEQVKTEPDQRQQGETEYQKPEEEITLEEEQQEQPKPEKVQQEQVKAETIQQETQKPDVETTEAPVEEHAKVQPSAGEKQEKTPVTEQSQSSGRTAWSVIKSIILWIVCIFLAFVGLLCFVPPTGIFFVLDGIALLILAVLACPFITARTKNIPVLAIFYQVKVPIVIVFAILAFVFMYLAGLSVS